MVGWILTAPGDLLAASTSMSCQTLTRFALPDGHQYIHAVKNCREMTGVQALLAGAGKARTPAARLFLLSKPVKTVIR